MIRLPKLPDPDSVLSVFDRASNTIDKGLGFIDKIENKLGQFIGPEKTATQQSIPTKGKGVTDQQTLVYQLEHIVAPLRQLELHLAEGGKIMNVPCDCIAKAAIDVAIFSEETIPIAARQGQDTKIYIELASWAKHMQSIGSEEAVKSGKYEETYRAESGNASRFRKQVQAMLSELKAASSEECVMCEGVQTLKEHMEKRKG